MTRPPGRLHRTGVVLLAAAFALFVGAHVAITATVRHLAGG